MSNLQEWWEDLKKHTIPPDAGEKQVRDMRIAFLIGVRETLYFVFEREMDPKNLARDLAEEVSRELAKILASLPEKE